MRIENLKEFIVYARELNVSRAAKRLNVAQSTLSRHLIEMEKDLGFEVVDRRNGNGLTAAGMRFLSDAERMLLIYEKGLNDCREIARSAEQAIIIQEYGGHPDVSEHLSSLVGKFNSTGSGVTIEWERFSGYDLTEAVLEGKLDVGQTVIHSSSWDRIVAELTARGVDVVPLHEEGIVYWMHKDEPLAQAGSATIDQLKHFSIAMPLGKVYNPMRNAMNELFMSRGLMPSFSYSKTWSVSDMSLPSDAHTACVLPPTAKTDPSLALRDDMRFVDVEDAKDGFITVLLFRSAEGNQRVEDFRAFVEEQLQINS